MAQYRIAWLPGDGVGSEVMDATRLVFDGMGFDADYIHGDIGWGAEADICEGHPGG